MPNPKFTPSEIRAAREACERATRGPWNIQEWRHWADPGKPNFTVQYTATDRYNRGAVFALATVELHGSGSGSSAANAAFIALARTALPAALDEIERFKKLLAEACDRWESLWQSEMATASDPESPSRLAELRKESSDV